MKRMGIAAVLVLLVAGVAATPASATGTLDQQFAPASLNLDGAFGSELLRAQTFTAGITGTLDQVDVALSKVGTPAGPLKVQIRTLALGGQPSATVLAEEDVPEASVPFDDWVAVPLSPPAPSVLGTRYAIVLSGPMGASFYSWSGANPGGYADGQPFFSLDNGSSWSLGGSADFGFKTYVTPTAPTSKDQCKNGGWKAFPQFKNQGECVSFVASKRQT
jgi:hypothetical protein